VSLAVVPLDWAVTDSYYVVAHMHYVLFGGVMFAVFAGVYYWFPKMTGRLLSERLGKWHFWLAFIGFHLTFLPQHWLGIAGMPRRVFTYAADTGWGPLNLLSSIGALVLGAGVAAFAWNLIASLRTGPPSGEDPWDGWTLEWSTASPPIPENFLRTPTVEGKRPLWDRKHPDQKDG
jgi:heme/copper-type cytochrome/quinol oxidase subunit 1